MAKSSINLKYLPNGDLKHATINYNDDSLSIGTNLVGTLISFSTEEVVILRKFLNNSFESDEILKGD